MKPTTENRAGWQRSAAVLLPLLLFVILSACAPPTQTSQALDGKLSQLQQQQQQQQQLLTQLQQQLSQLQQQLDGAHSTRDLAVQAPEVPAPEQTPTSQRPVEISPTDETAEVKLLVEAASLYLEAFSALSMGRHELAGNGFSEFLAKYANHTYAGNARYWLAETEIARGLHQQAQDNLLLVADDTKPTGKAPAALARLIEFYQQQNMPEQADTILHQLLTRFPQSREAQLFNRSDPSQ